MAGPLILLICTRVRRLGARFAALAARVRAGTLRSPAPARRRAAPARRRLLRYLRLPRLVCRTTSPGSSGSWGGRRPVAGRSCSFS